MQRFEAQHHLLINQNIAPRGDRTLDLLLTKQLPCHLAIEALGYINDVLVSFAEMRTRYSIPANSDAALRVGSEVSAHENHRLPA